MKKKLLSIFTLLLCLTTGAWADSQTIECGTVTTGAFTYSDLASYSYTSNNGWAKDHNGHIIAIASEGSFTFKNAGGSTITGITVQGVADNNSAKESTVTISDGTNSVTTGQTSWKSRKGSDGDDPTIVNITSGISDLNMAANTTYTVSNSGYKLGIQIVITYTSSGSGKTASECAFNNSTPSINFPATTTYQQIATTASGYDGNISYALSENTCGATIDGSSVTVTQAGSVKVTATAPETESYTSSSASYTLTVTDTRTALTGAWTPTSLSCSVGDSPAAPTFAVTGGEAALGTDYTVAYSKVSGDDLAIFTASGGITAIDASATGTETIRATVTLTNTNDYKLATTEYDIVITVSNTHTVTYDANGGSGVSPTDATAYAEGASVTVVDSYGTLTKTGYSIVGWNTDRDATSASQAFGSSFVMGDADITLYAIWQENFYEFTPSGTVSSDSMEDGAVVESSTGGTMNYTPISTTKATLKYAGDGLEFGGSGDCLVTITMNDLMKEGSVIVAKMSYSDDKTGRGVQLRDASGNNLGSSWTFTGDGQDHVFTYTVTGSQANSNSFQLKRVGNAYLKSLTVTNSQPGGTISASGWNTYSSNKKLDLSTIANGTAYVASGTGDGKVVMKECTDVVAAGTGLMIKGSAGSLFTIDTAADDATFNGTNLLEGLPNGGVAPVGSYVFGWPTADPTGYGFYYVNESAVNLGAGKSYLSTGSGARMVITFDEDTTGIEDLKDSRNEDLKSYYDLSGRRVDNPTKGLYIVNGKKYLVK